MRSLQRSVAVFAAVIGTSAKKVAEIDAMKHDINQLYQHNFDSVIGTSLPLTVSSVLYFKGSSSADATFIDTHYNGVAERTKKMLKVAAVDCDDAPKMCERVGVKETPHVHIYPQSPRPHFRYEGKMETESILNQLYKLVPGDKVNMFKSLDEFNGWKKRNPIKPKIVLFSDKKKPPTILKGLSTDSVFARTVEFAYVNTALEEGDAIAADTGAKKKKQPAIMQISKGKNIFYKEEDKAYGKLYDWINLTSESGMGDTVKGVGGSAEVGAEEIEYEKVRELHAKSQRELCTGQKNICAIYLSNGPLPEKDIDMITKFESKFEAKNDRGVKYNWMWLDVSVEEKFKTVIEEQEVKQAEREDRDVEQFAYPTMIFVKPPKKKREEKLLTYLRLPGEGVQESTVADVVERIAGGATYIRTDLPTFTVRSKVAPKKKGKEEL